ncbi:MAG TPA: DNA polymerase III subunit epsilon [Sedimenticola sp.]|nr:DNA polymerase III subunit epsilon [Sedimenticola sp.]
MRQIVLDTETTGLEPSQGHRIIEIGCVEMVDRRLSGNNFHQYLQPEREIDPAAVEVHGITNEFLADKPRFADVVDDFMTYIQGAELIIHNAPFDVGFIDHELQMLNREWPFLGEWCRITDTLVMAKKLHPGQRNSLDALCRRYDVNNSHRELHGALLDAEILADVYLAMTGGQGALSLDGQTGEGKEGVTAGIRRLAPGRPALRVVRASKEELASHRERLQAIDQASGGGCLWLKLEPP